MGGEGGWRGQGQREGEGVNAGRKHVLCNIPTLYLGRCAKTSDGSEVAGLSAAALVACFAGLLLEAAGCCAGADAWDCPAPAPAAAAAWPLSDVLPAWFCLDPACLPPPYGIRQGEWGKGRARAMAKW